MAKTTRLFNEISSTFSARLHAKIKEHSRILGESYEVISFDDSKASFLSHKTGALYEYRENADGVGLISRLDYSSSELQNRTKIAARNLVEAATEGKDVSPYLGEIKNILSEKSFLYRLPMQGIFPLSEASRKKVFNTLMENSLFKEYLSSLGESVKEGKTLLVEAMPFVGLRARDKLIKFFKEQIGLTYEQARVITYNLLNFGLGQSFHERFDFKNLYHALSSQLPAKKARNLTYTIIETVSNELVNEQEVVNQDQIKKASDLFKSMQSKKQAIQVKPEDLKDPKLKPLFGTDGTFSIDAVSADGQVTLTKTGTAGAAGAKKTVSSIDLLNVISKASALNAAGVKEGLMPDFGNPKISDITIKAPLAAARIAGTLLAGKKDSAEEDLEAEELSPEDQLDELEGGGFPEGLPVDIDEMEEMPPEGDFPPEDEIEGMEGELPPEDFEAFEGEEEFPEEIEEEEVEAEDPITATKRVLDIVSEMVGEKKEGEEDEEPSDKELEELEELEASIEKLNKFIEKESDEISEIAAGSVDVEEGEEIEEGEEETPEEEEVEEVEDEEEVDEVEDEEAEEPEAEEAAEEEPLEEAKKKSIKTEEETDDLSTPLKAKKIDAHKVEEEDAPEGQKDLGEKSWKDAKVKKTHAVEEVSPVSVGDKYIIEDGDDSIKDTDTDQPLPYGEYTVVNVNPMGIVFLQDEDGVKFSVNEGELTAAAELSYSPIDDIDVGDTVELAYAEKIEQAKEEIEAPYNDEDIEEIQNMEFGKVQDCTTDEIVPEGLFIVTAKDETGTFITLALINDEGEVTDDTFNVSTTDLTLFTKADTKVKESGEEDDVPKTGEDAWEEAEPPESSEEAFERVQLKKEAVARPEERDLLTDINELDLLEVPEGEALTDVGAGDPVPELNLDDLGVTITGDMAGKPAEFPPMSDADVMPPTLGDIPEPPPEPAGELEIPELDAIQPEENPDIPAPAAESSELVEPTTLETEPPPIDENLPEIPSDIPMEASEASELSSIEETEPETLVEEQPAEDSTGNEEYFSSSEEEGGDSTGKASADSEISSLVDKLDEIKNKLLSLKTENEESSKAYQTDAEIAEYLELTEGLLNKIKESPDEYTKDQAKQFTEMFIPDEQVEGDLPEKVPDEDEGPEPEDETPIGND